MAGRTLWIDASAGVAGDMLLGALVDAGASLEAVQRAVDAVVPGAVHLTAHDVTRAGLHATKVEVEVLVADPSHRTWATIRSMLDAADLPAPVRTAARTVFGRLAEAEGHVHGIPATDVHFHEVGALDAIADVVGTASALHELGADHVLVSPVALGSGTAHAAHGELPVPVPAVLALSRGWQVLAGGRGERATPTGMALVTGLAAGSAPLPALTVEAVGTGAGTRDDPDRANVVRVVLGRASEVGPGGDDGQPDAVQLEANVDDLDPRLWPDVLAALLDAGAHDAWLTPITMKKGRPAHTLGVLAPPARADALTGLVLRHTTTLGVRSTPVTRTTLDRTVVEVELDDRVVRVKLGHRDGVLVQVMPEYEDVRGVARDREVPVREVLAQAHAAALSRGLVLGGPLP